jgi:hypothetical protein
MENLHSARLNAIGVADGDAVGSLVHDADADAGLREGRGGHETGRAGTDDENVNLRVLNWHGSHG